ncbi:MULTISPECIES: hypothetical protein [unclassified Rhodococcus (in: high G+C Gram-positive bacteria)]|uniref:hypothetical protein n=1 Tax=unclassified Rhodococcus (in: high G+C Gram-positive bacteria) TaxID=192944 RepID=UPI000B0DFAFC|nr:MULTISPECIES: hypothetical protein [unclassified Rhodococcus (in: high G+C Gram-positive bacteria)]MBY4403475.1 hypothetical protein [Rhodococcus fascians]MBY4418984.1 hypothetical protein [Rhodococcus fascians]
MDASEFVSATSEVRKLWDEADPDTGTQFDLDDRTTPEIEIPPGGWFETALERQKPPPRDPNAPRRINYAIGGDD